MNTKNLKLHYTNSIECDMDIDIYAGFVWERLSYTPPLWSFHVLHYMSDKFEMNTEMYDIHFKK